MRISYAIVFTNDMARAVAFYRDVLGIPLRFETPQWSEFTTDGATLALHRTSTRPMSVEERDLEPAGACRPGFQGTGSRGVPSPDDRE